MARTGLRRNVPAPETARLCNKFLRWSKVDRFFAAWRDAGFRVGGHIVFRKRYTSKSALLQYRHELAYLLVKGNPPAPLQPPPDVIDWTYTRNRLHPTQKPTSILMPLIRSFTKQGDMVLDPFAGSGSTLIAARHLGRDYLGIELDAAHHATASNRLAIAEGSAA
jgi:site-specific DNA-methyltransferase (adenine-specific)